MSPTGNTLPAGWTYLMRVMMVSLALSVSVCPAPGTPARRLQITPLKGDVRGR
jgi:hypothetical protein